MASERSPSPPAPSSPSLDPLLESVLNGLPDGVILLDTHWRIAYANRRACEISRILPQHLNSLTHWQLFPETVGTIVEETYFAAVRTQTEQTLEPYFYAPFNLWVRVRVIPAHNGVLLYYRDVTGEHLSKAEASALESRLEQVLEATTDGIVSVDRDWCIGYMNTVARTILAPSGNILHTNIWQSFPHANYPGSPYVEHYNRAMNDRIPCSFEAFYPEPLNAWLHIIARPAPDGIIVFFRDITLQKQREEALRDSEARYRVLTELSPQSQWTANPQGLVLYANRRFLDYIGHDFVPRTGLEYILCFDPADRQRVIDVWTHSVATGEDYNIDARLLRASDGASRWWNLRALPLRDDDGNIQQWLGTASDIHESRLAAERLREQYEEIDRRRRELEAIYRGSPIGMALYEPKELRLLRINDRQAEIMRLSPEESIGKRYEDLTSGIPQAMPLIRRAQAGESVLNHQLDGSLDRHPGEHRFWNVNYSPIFAEDGTVQAIAAATIEITQQKRAEAALMQSEKLAAVGRMASSIAHEINNPLESVTNLIYIARQHAFQPELQTFLDLADQELRRVSIIANQTLRFHKQATNPRAISSVELFTTVLSIYEGRLRNARIKVEKRRLVDRQITCFEGEIRQVLNNLVSNAIDAMPQGGRLILRSQASRDWRPGPGHYRPGLVLTIADTGTGIDPANQRRIFEAFFTTKGMQGTGLGLWISAEIMQRHNGFIRMRSSRSSLRHGTVFSLFLPFEGTPIPDISRLDLPHDNVN